MNKNTWIGIIVGIVIVIVLGVLLLGFKGKNSVSNLYPNIPGTNYQNSTSTSGNTVGNTGGNIGTTPPSNTTPPTPTPPPSGTINGPIAYIGCSNTWMTVEGYHNVGGTKFWPADQHYGGGTVEVWATNLTNSNDYWQQFDQLNSQNPGAKTVWFNLCEKQGHSYDEIYSNATKVIAEAKRRIPGATVYVSGLNTYATSNQCSITGTTGVPYTNQAAAALVQSGLALQGPALGPLSKDQTKDGCHPEAPARLIVGQQLFSFFK